MRSLCPSGAHVLDLCTGTADLAVAIARRISGSSVVGVDFAAEMLQARQPEGARSRARKVHQARARRCGRAFRSRDASCDGATVAFGIRNVAEPALALAELARVLRPGGRLAILEFGQPRIPGIRTLYAWYFRYLLPLVGRTISKHQSAYSYLPASVGTFPSPPEFLQMCESSGFSRARAVPLTFGIVYLYVAERE